MERRVPEYVIFHDMVHVRAEEGNRALCGLSLDGVISEPKKATHGFCLTCQEKHQLPDTEAPLVL